MTKMALVRDAGVVCIIIGLVTKLVEQPVYGDRFAFPRVALIEAGCGIVALSLWASLCAATARREQRQRTRRGFDVAPPSGRPPASG